MRAEEDSAMRVAEREKRTLPEHGVYVVITGAQRPDIAPVEIARRAIEGGAAIIQVREKSLPRMELETLARRVATLCRDHGVRFIVNDDPELAVAVDADGVHLGQEDLARFGLERVRAIVGERIIGLSTHSPEQFASAMAMDIDYASFGPLYPTHAKNYHLGDAAVAGLLASATKPVVLIGGLTRENLPALVARGCRIAGVIRDVIQAEDIAAATAEFRAILERGGSPLSATAVGVHGRAPLHESNDRPLSIRLRVNGKETETPAGSVLSLLLARGHKPEAVIVERNGDFLARSTWAATMLEESDKIEIVSMMCGG
jgi:thiamine-phosphate pyrophosphorylase